MSEIYDNSELGDTYRPSLQDTAFPIHEENVASDDEANDLDSAYNHLTLFEKLKDNRWQLRRRAYTELYDFFETGKVPMNCGGDELKPESMVPWIQNMINEPNMIAMVDALKALNAFLTHHTCSRPQLASFTGRLIDKLVLTKKNIQNNILEILDKLLEGDEANNIINEILKRLDNKNFKFLNMLLNILLKFVKTKQGPDDAHIRIIFKFIAPLMSHPNKETRHLALEILRVLYSYIEETFKELKGFAFENLRNVQLKELEVLQNTTKVKGRKLVKLNDGTYKSSETGAKKPQPTAQKVDLLSLLPEKYLEVPYLVQSSGESFVQFNQNEKKKKLEEFNQRLEQTLRHGSEIDTHKDYSVILNLLKTMLEDKNILINTEAVKSVDYMIKMLKNNFPQSNLKYILTLIIEKLDAKKKTAYNTSLIQVIDDSIAYNCMVPETLCDLILYNAENNKNMNVRTACFNWFGSSFLTFLTAKRDVLYSNMSRVVENQRPEKASVTAKGAKLTGGYAHLDPEERIERLLEAVYKRIQQQQKKEGNITLKKKCQQILESLGNLYAKAEVISPPKEDRENFNALNDISSIKGNSKVVNMSNLTLPQGEYEENKENDEEEAGLITEERTNRFEGSSSRRSEFAFENLRQADKDQFGKLMSMFSEIKAQDEHVVEKMDAIGGFVDKMNMEVIQAAQTKIVQVIKKTLRGHLQDYRNVLKLFESANNLLIKINKICLEIHPETLKVELKIMLLFLANVLNGKSLEKTLDSMYMTCSLDKFLFCSLELFEKIDTKYVRMIPEEKLANAVRIYMNWLVVKVEKIQNVMFEGDQLRNLERDFAQFRFSNLPQVHLGVSNVLSKKLKTVEDHSAGNSSVRSCQTPRVQKHRTVSVDTSTIKEESRMDDLNEVEQNQISQKLNNIQEQVKSDVKGGLDKFSTLLSSIKKKNLDRLNMSHCMSPTPGGDSVSPNRHWKRGLGRDSTPPGMRKMSLGSDLSASLRKSRALHNLPGGENAEQNKSMHTLDVEAAAKFLANACSNLTEKDMASFELSLFKLKSLYAPKDYLYVLNTITPRLLAKEFFNTRVPETRIIKMLKNHLESLDKPAYLRTLKALFCMKSRENDNEALHNIAKVGIELTISFYTQARFPPKVIPIIVEMVVFSLTDHSLRAHGEEVLEAVTKSVGRDGLRRYFEVELINSTRLYQAFLSWIDQQQSFGASPAQQKKELSPIQQKDQTLEEGNETHTLHDDSFNNSVTPQKHLIPPKRVSPTLNLKHSFDKALEEAEPQDMQFSRILENEEFDGPNFGIRHITDTEPSKGLQSLRNMFPTTEKRERPEDHGENPDVLEFQGVPSFADFKQHIRPNFGVSDFNPSSEQKEPTRRAELQQRRMNRAVLGERNLEDLPGMVNNNMGYQQRNVQDDKENVGVNQSDTQWYERGMKKEARDSTPEKIKMRYNQGKEEVSNFMPSREMVIGYQTGSIQENKENVGVNNPDWYGKGMMMKKEVKDGSAEKWKTKYIQEKERLQQTLEMLEKANTGYLSHVTEKSDLLEKLNNQRQLNESLYDKFNNVASENERLKKDLQNSEMEKLRASQSMMPPIMLSNKQEHKKFLNQKFITETLAIAAKGQTKNKDEFIKQFQELLLTADNLEFEVGESLMKIYEELEEYGEKVQFVVNLKNSVTHPQVLGNLSVPNHKFLLEIALQLCVSENTQREIVLGEDGVTFIETDLTNEMQLLLDGLLRFHSLNATITNLLRILSDQMPTDFDADMSKGTKMLLKLTVKCLVKLSSNFKTLITEEIRVFDVLVEIYKLFKLHPPENLKEGQPNIKDFEIIFRNIRTLADHVIDLNPNRAKEFASFFSRENNKSIFLDYVKSYTTKYYPNLSGSMNLSDASF